MPWPEKTLDELAALPAIGYLAGGAPAAEPTALATLAFAAQARLDNATKSATALALMQDKSGAVGVRSNETPGWPTSLAILAWNALGNLDKAFADEKKSNVKRAVDWLLANRGRAIPRSGEFGHNSELVGWAYAENTHSWVEPTAMAVMALASQNQLNHSATQEGLSILLDRQLPGGGYNYGNTYVLGQLIRPHIQPTGIAILALAVTAQHKDRAAKSVAWLRRSIGPSTTPVSLAWALLGLKAHGVNLQQADSWLAAAAERVKSHDRSPHKLALLALAAKGWPA